MKILQMCSYYYSSSIYANLFPQIESLDTEQIVYVPLDKKTNLDRTKKLSIIKGQFFLSKPYSKYDRLNYFSKIRKIFNDINQVMTFDDIDLIHAHSLFINGGVSYKLKKQRNIDYIVAVRSTDVDVFFRYFIHLRKFGIEILKNAGKLIFISRNYRDKLIYNYVPEYLQDEFLSKSMIIPNGIDNFWIENKYKKSKNNFNSIKLIYVGRFIKRKNIPLCIQVTSLLREKGYNADISIIGSGELESKLKKISKRHSDYVRIHNWLDSKNELIKLYRNSDIFITPSHTETFGLVYLEAMSQGLPVIYTKNEGFDGLFENGTVGYSVDIDKNDIVDKIISIIDDYDRISNNCTSLVDSYNWQDIAKQYVETYKTILNSVGTSVKIL